MYCRSISSAWSKKTEEQPLTSQNGYNGRMCWGNVFVICTMNFDSTKSEWNSLFTWRWCKLDVHLFIYQISAGRLHVPAKVYECAVRLVLGNFSFALYTSFKTIQQLLLNQPNKMQVVWTILKHASFHLMFSLTPNISSTVWFFTLYIKSVPHMDRGMTQTA